MNNLKAVATYPETMTAHIKQQELETAGIPAEVYIHRENEQSFTHVSSASLMVAKQDLERATIFLNTHIPEPETVSRHKWCIHCPECNSHNTTSKAGFWSRLVDYLTLDVFVFFTNRKKDKHYCNDCGHHWRVWFDGN